MSSRLSHRLAGRLLLVLLATLLALYGAIGVQPAAAQTDDATTDTTPATGPDTTAAAYIVVDVSTGEVLAQSNAREALRPASVTKVVTAVAIRRTFSLETTTAVSERAAAMPARKLNLVPGSVWNVDQLLHGLLMSSANDVALTLAEAAGSGSAEAFAGSLQQVATELGMADSPTLVDPSGLDDASSVNGGNLISAYDLAIAGRALLADPYLSSIVSSTEFSFVDPTGTQRRLVNGNKMLSTYPGAIGVKTGYTRVAGRTLMTAVARDDRTILTVVINAPDMYGLSTLLLDNAFAIAPAQQPDAEFLPQVPLQYLPIARRLTSWPGLVGTASPFGTGGSVAAATPTTIADTSVSTTIEPDALSAVASGTTVSDTVDSPQQPQSGDSVPLWLQFSGGALGSVFALRLRALIVRRRRRLHRAHVRGSRMVDESLPTTRDHVRPASDTMYDARRLRGIAMAPAAPDVHQERVGNEAIVVVVDGASDPAAFEDAPTYRRTTIRSPRSS